MARNGRPADHSCRGSRGIETQGRELLFEFHTLQTRAYDFPPVQKDFFDLVIIATLLLQRFTIDYASLFAIPVTFIYKTLFAPTKTDVDVTPRFMLLSRSLCV